MSRRKVPVVLLSEIHTDKACAMENVKLLSSLVVPEDPRTADERNFLLVSEGRDMNMCYKAIRLPPSRNIQEYGTEQSDIEMLDKFLLQQELVYGIADRRYKHGSRLTDTITMSHDFMVERYSQNGFKALLAPLQIDYLAMLDAAFRNDRTTVNKMMKDILNKLVDKFPILLKPIESAEVVSFHSFLPILDKIRKERDNAIIKKVEDRVRAELANGFPLKNVYILFGQLHNANLSDLIRQSDILTLDPKSRGGYRTKRKTIPRKTRKRRRYK